MKLENSVLPTTQQPSTSAHVLVQHVGEVSAALGRRALQGNSLGLQLPQRRKFCTHWSIAQEVTFVLAPGRHPRKAFHSHGSEVLRPSSWPCSCPQHSFPKDVILPLHPHQGLCPLPTHSTQQLLRIYSSKLKLYV